MLTGTPTGTGAGAGATGAGATDGMLDETGDVLGNGLTGRTGSSIKIKGFFSVNLESS